MEVQRAEVQEASSKAVEACVRGAFDQEGRRRVEGRLQAVALEEQIRARAGHIQAEERIQVEVRPMMSNLRKPYI